jgi:hypothetical protein
MQDVRSWHSKESNNDGVIDPQLARRFQRLRCATTFKHKSCTQTTIKFVCWMPPLMRYQNGVAALVTDVIRNLAPI